MLGDKIKELRIRKGLTQQKLADATNISRSAIGMVEKNKQGLGRENLIIISNFFDVPVDYLLSDDDYKPDMALSSNMLGDKVKMLRKSLRITQKDLADSIGVSQSTIGMIEGNKQGASNDTLLKLARALNTTVDYLLSDDDKANDVIDFKELNEKDKKSITKDLKVLMEEFREGTDGTAYYNGQELAEEDLDLIESAMKIALEQIKIKNKEKYTPNKYKK
ncbi:helix-turn-helix domain-containing protein [Clostridium cadaveris]|uniref:helix-turn-helix domain-containing protein n=1 Tax=Clostridium cadaveris TaxID=1529 RepID=UPI0003F81D3C|nr:helix-turn-helix transcriptional regulator [Clostridium cadaveris]